VSLKKKKSSIRWTPGDLEKHGADKRHPAVDRSTAECIPDETKK